MKIYQTNFKRGRNLNIGIDGRKLCGNKTGIGNYLKNILLSLLNMNDDSIKWKIYIYVDDYSNFDSELARIIKKNEYVKVVELGNVRWKIPKLFYTIFWFQILLPIYLRKNRINVFWGPNFLKPLLFSSKKSIITIHDLAFIDQPSFESKIYGKYLKFFLNLTINKKLEYTVVSKFTRDRLIYNFPKINPKKISIAYCALDEKNKYNYREIITNIEFEEYFCFVGTTNRRKNLKIVIEALFLLKKENIYKNFVVVGGKGDCHDEIKKLIEKYSLENQVKFMGYISEEEKQYIILKSKCFVFPSFYEGFGIPLVEAMGLNVPIIASDIQVTREVMGKNKATYFNPNNPIELKNILQNFDSDIEINNYEINNRFDWDISANTIKNQFIKIGTT